jgi:hypothetical protein
VLTISEQTKVQPPDLMGSVGYADDVQSDGKSGGEAAYVVYGRRRVGVELDLTVLIVRDGQHVPILVQMAVHGRAAH